MYDHKKMIGSRENEKNNSNGINGFFVFWLDGWRMESGRKNHESVPKAN
ncbi:hypothetical protein PRUB_b0332 [Pseudoalteromonas rubra]|uniref:Uncharacterized protein n=1 Tax=Pseudoalteromonas rubra TaxID=43658 RepID=A0A8T0C1R6_9GAMM|nr:hypothetical protein PRUB_b0332 [Pseudoalteromonas rubra]